VNTEEQLRARVAVLTEERDALKAQLALLVPVGELEDDIAGWTP
jgi:hypothetical protein